MAGGRLASGLSPPGWPHERASAKPLPISRVILGGGGGRAVRCRRPADSRFTPSVERPRFTHGGDEVSRLRSRHGRVVAAGRWIGNTLHDLRRRWHRRWRAHHVAQRGDGDGQCSEHVPEWSASRRRQEAALCALPYWVTLRRRRTRKAVPTPQGDAARTAALPRYFAPNRHGVPPGVCVRTAMPPVAALRTPRWRVGHAVRNHLPALWHTVPTASRGHPGRSLSERAPGAARCSAAAHRSWCWCCRIS